MREMLRFFVIAMALTGIPALAQDPYEAVWKEVGVLYAKGEYFNALDRANRILLNEPNNINALLTRADTYGLLGLYKEGIADCTKFLALVKSDKDRNYCWRTRGLHYYRDKQDELGIADLTRAFEYSDKVPSHFYVTRSNMFLAIGKFPEALGDAEEALTKEPASVCNLYQRAFVYLHLNEPAKAATDINRYVASTLNDPNCLSSLQGGLSLQGRALFMLGRLEEAKAVRRRMYEPGAGLSGDDYSIFFDWEKRRSLESDWLQKAKDAEAGGNLTEAFKLYSQLITWGLRVTRKDQEAVEEARASLVRLYPNLPEKPVIAENHRRLLIQARTYIKNHQYDRAARSYAFLSDSHPWIPEAYFNLALIYREQKVFGRAIANMRTYLKLMPNAEGSRAAQDNIYEWEALAAAAK